MASRKRHHHQRNRLSVQRAGSNWNFGSFAKKNVAGTQKGGKPQNKQFGIEHNPSSTPGKHRMLKNISLHSMSKDIINAQNKFQQKISAIVKEYKEVQRRPLDFKLFLQTLAGSRPFLARLKNEEGAARIPFQSLKDAFQAAGMDMNLYETQQHLKYIVGLALQEATGGGESDKSTDVGKIVCGIIGAIGGSDYYVRRDLLHQFCVQRTKSILNVAGHDHVAKKALEDLLPTRHLECKLLDRFVAEFYTDVTEKLQPSSTDFLTHKLFNNFIKKHSDAFPGLLTGLTRIKLGVAGISATDEAEFEEYHFNRKFKRKNSLNYSKTPSKSRKGKKQPVSNAPEIDNNSFHDENNESVTIDVNTVETKVSETSAGRKYELPYDVFRVVTFCTFLCLDLAIAHALQNLVGIDTALSYVYTALFNISGLILIWVGMLVIRCLARVCHCRHQNHIAEHDRSSSGGDQSNFDESEIDADKSISSKRDEDQTSRGTFGENKEYNDPSGRQHTLKKMGTRIAARVVQGIGRLRRASSFITLLSSKLEIADRDPSTFAVCTCSLQINRRQITRPTYTLTWIRSGGSGQIASNLSFTPSTTIRYGQSWTFCLSFDTGDTIYCRAQNQDVYTQWANALQPIVKPYGDSKDNNAAHNADSSSYTTENTVMSNSYSSHQPNSPSLAKHSMSETMTPEPPTLVRHRSHTDRSRPPSLSVNALNEPFRFQRHAQNQPSIHSAAKDGPREGTQKIGLDKEPSSDDKISELQNRMDSYEIYIPNSGSNAKSYGITNVSAGGIDLADEISILDDMLGVSDDEEFVG